MIERKKVIKGLECCSKYTGDECDNCPYDSACKPKRGGRNPLMVDALALLKTQEPRVMTIQEIKNANFCYLEVNGHDGVTPVLLKHFVDDKYIHVTINGGSVYFFDITCDVGKLVRCWTSRPDEKMREKTPWGAQEQRDYESAIEMAEYCERYGPTYSADDGSM